MPPAADPPGSRPSEGAGRASVRLRILQPCRPAAGPRPGGEGWETAECADCGAAVWAYRPADPAPVEVSLVCAACAAARRGPRAT